MERQSNFFTRLEALIGNDAIQTLGDKSVFVVCRAWHIARG